MRIKTYCKKKIVIACDHVGLIRGKIEPGHHMTLVYYADQYHGELNLHVHHCIQCCHILPDIIAIKSGLTGLNPEILRCESVVMAEREERRKHCEKCSFCAKLAIEAGHDYELMAEAGLINDEHRRAMQT